ncbi:MAG: alpha-1,4-glucan--maltose-1-phosphate maltosyltransferase [Candidatus Omnitrophica bacterium]|nr:alpha-1,4-glucan--maltose-1-phosphate maltosyltransferase [Candidatus Omnitrophota bacterium]
MTQLKTANAKHTFQRVIIEHLAPEIDGGVFPIKRVPQEQVAVMADIYTEGHDSVNAVLLYRKLGEKAWKKLPMTSLGNDRWRADFVITEQSDHEYCIEAWVNHFETWQKDFKKRIEAGQDVTVDILIGINYLKHIVEQEKGKEVERIKSLLEEIQKASNSNQKQTLLLSAQLLSLTQATPDTASYVCYDKVLKVQVNSPKALLSSWYEFFPRSFGKNGKHGTFKDCEAILPEIARMGFDVIYLPPIHPIGTTHRKGKNNARVGGPNDPGSPWAIGGQGGGHKAIDARLGTMDDFHRFIKKANSLGLEVSIDIAYQCSPDHPYVKEHPEWFYQRPDGTIQYAENPPKKYEDVYPVNFYCSNSFELWQELKSIVDFWIDQGITIFRVDNPHTKPFAFWQWMIGETHKNHPEVVFLAEAFTRPNIMKQLGKVGFHQSYTYFTWRVSKAELIEYMTELTQTESREYFRPNFWPNTPDILPYHLQTGGRPAFISRLILAATLSSNYGLYGPAYELCVNTPVAGKEEYFDSEKYEIKQWNWNEPQNLKDIMTRINRIRKRNPALQTTWNVKFCDVNNDNLIAYYKKTDDSKNIILVIVNLDSANTQAGTVKLPLGQWGFAYDQSYKVVDLLTSDEYSWQGEWNFVELNPYKMPAHIFSVQQA